MSEAQDLLQGARVVSVGSFRLDRSRAMEKLSRFQLQDPHDYVLELVSAALLAGSTDIRVDDDADDLIMAWDGDHPELEDMNRLFDHVFARPTDRRGRMLQHLAQGLFGAMGLAPRWIRMERPGLTVDLTNPLEPLSSPNERTAGVRVHVRERLGLGVLRAAILPASRSHRREILRRRARYCPIPLYIADEPLAAPARPPVTWPCRTPPDGCLWLSPTSHRPVDVVRDGVVVVSIPMRRGSLALTGWIHAPDLNLDASRSAVVNDERRAALDTLLHATCGELLAELRGLDPAPVDDEVLDLAILRHIVTSDEPGSMGKLTCVRDALGRRFNIDQLRARAEVGITDDASLVDPDLHSPLFLTPTTEVPAEDASIADLSRWVVGRFIPASHQKDLGPELRTRKEAQNRRKEAGRTTEPLSFGSAALLERTFEDTGMRGCVAFIPTKAENAPEPDEASFISLDLRVDRIHVETKPHPFPVSLAARVEGDALRADTAFRYVVRDTDYGLLVARVESEATAMLLELAARKDLPPIVRRAFLGWVLREAESRRKKKKAGADECVSGIPESILCRPMLEDLAGTPISIRAILSGPRPVRHVTTGFPLSCTEAGVLILDSIANLALDALLGDGLVNVEPELMARAEASRRRALPPATPRLLAHEGPRGSLQDGEMTGEFGLCATSSASDCEATLICQGVPLGDLLLPLNLPGTRAVVAWDRAQPNLSWTRPADPEATALDLASHLEGPILELALREARSWQATSAPLPVWLIGLLTRRDLPDGTLWDLPLFRNLDGAPLSLRAIQEGLGKETVMYVRHPTPDPPPTTGRFLVLDPGRLEILKVNLGVASLKDASRNFKERREQWLDFLSIPRSPLRVPASEAVGVTLFEGPGFRGTAGLRKASSCPGLTVRCLFEERIFHSLIRPFPIEILANIEGDAIRPGPSLKGLTGAPPLDSFEQAVGSILDTMLACAMKEGGIEDSILRQILGMIVGPDETRLSPDSCASLLEQLRDHPLLPSAQGRLVSYQEAVEAGARGNLRVVTTLPIDLIPSTDRLWVIQVPGVEKILAGTPFTRGDPEIAEMLAGRERRARIPIQGLAEEGPAIASCTEEMGAMGLWLGLMGTDPAGLHLTWLVEGRPLLTENRPFPVNIRLRLAHPGLKSDPGFRQILPGRERDGVEAVISDSIPRFLERVAQAVCLSNPRPPPFFVSDSLRVRVVLLILASRDPGLADRILSGSHLVQTADSRTLCLEELRAALALGPLRIVPSSTRGRTLDPKRPALRLEPGLEQALRALGPCENFEKRLGDEEQAWQRRTAPPCNPRRLEGSDVLLDLPAPAGRQGFVQVTYTHKDEVDIYHSWRRLTRLTPRGPIPLTGAVDDPALQPGELFRLPQNDIAWGTLQADLGATSHQALVALLDRPLTDPLRAWFIHILPRAFPRASNARKATGDLGRLADLPIFPAWNAEVPPTRTHRSLRELLALKKLRWVTPGFVPPPGAALAEAPWVELDFNATARLGHLMTGTRVDEDAIRMIAPTQPQQPLALPAGEWLARVDLDLDGIQGVAALSQDLGIPGCLLLRREGQIEKRDLPLAGMTVILDSPTLPLPLSKKWRVAIQKTHEALCQNATERVYTEAGPQKALERLLRARLMDVPPLRWREQADVLGGWLKAPLLVTSSGRTSLAELATWLRKGPITMGDPGCPTPLGGQPPVLQTTFAGPDLPRQILPKESLRRATWEAPTEVIPTATRARLLQAHAAWLLQGMDDGARRASHIADLLDGSGDRMLRSLAPFQSAPQELGDMLRCWWALDREAARNGNRDEAMKLAVRLAEWLERRQATWVSNQDSQGGNKTKA